MSHSQSSIINNRSLSTCSDSLSLTGVRGILPDIFLLSSAAFCSLQSGTSISSAGCSTASVPGHQATSAGLGWEAPPAGGRGRPGRRLQEGPVSASVQERVPHGDKEGEIEGGRGRGGRRRGGRRQERCESKKLSSSFRWLIRSNSSNAEREQTVTSQQSSSSPPSSSSSSSP